MNKWCSSKKSFLGFFMLMFLFMPLIPILDHTSTKKLGFENLKKNGGFTCTSAAPLDFPCFWNDTAFQERKQQAMEEIISSNTYNESLGIIGDSGTGVRNQGYYVLSMLQSNNDSLVNLSRASSVITSLHEKYQIREKYRGARQYGGFLKELDMDLDEYDGNYANFMAPFLGCIALEHREDLTPPARRHLHAMLKTLSSCVHAQDNHVDYTNMFLLRVYSLLLLGEYFNDDSMRYEGRHHWERWIDLVLREGFPEHNSPNYGFIDAWALEGIYMHSVDRHMQLQARAILEWFWLDYGQHYHPSTGYHAGSGARVKNSDRYYGIGSHQNPLFIYFNEGSGIASSSASRLFTIKNYMPPEYVKEVTLEKQYPFHVKTRNFGTDTYTYMTQDYSFGTESGCKYPSKAGYTASQISGERLPGLITYMTNHSRKSAVIDTNPHYQAITSLQDGSTAILLVNFDVPEKRKSDEIYLEAWVGSRTALESIQGEIRVNNITWTGDPLALEDGDRLTVKINNTFIGFCPVASQVDHVDDSLLDNSCNTVLRWEENHDAGSEDLLLRAHVFKDEGNETWYDDDRNPGTGFIIEVGSAADDGTFDVFSNSFMTSTFHEEYSSKGKRRVSYLSARTGRNLTLVDNMETNEMVNRTIDGIVHDSSNLLESNYTKIGANPTFSDLRTCFRVYNGSFPNLGGFKDLDIDGMPDSWERTFVPFGQPGLNPALDEDGDGLSNIEEFSMGLSPVMDDFDLDGKTDFLDPQPANGVRTVNRSMSFYIIMFVVITNTIPVFLGWLHKRGYLSIKKREIIGRLRCAGITLLLAGILLEMVRISFSISPWLEFALSSTRLTGILLYIFSVHQGIRFMNPVGKAGKSSRMDRNKGFVMQSFPLAGIGITSAFTTFLGISLLSSSLDWMIYIAVFGELIFTGAFILSCSVILLVRLKRVQKGWKALTALESLLLLVGAAGLAINPILTLTRSSIEVLYLVASAMAFLVAISIEYFKMHRAYVPSIKLPKEQPPSPGTG